MPKVAEKVGWPILHAQIPPELMARVKEVQQDEDYRSLADATQRLIELALAAYEGLRDHSISIRSSHAIPWLKESRIVKDHPQSHRAKADRR